MSFNSKPLSIRTGEEVEKQEPFGDTSPALLPQNPNQIPLEPNKIIKNNTPNYGESATPINLNGNNNEINDNIHINNVIVLPPNYLIKAKVLYFIQFGICLIDILVHIIMKIKSALNITTDIINMIYSILLLIFLYSKVGLNKRWIMFLVNLMNILILLFETFGSAKSLAIALNNDNRENDIEIIDENIMFLIFFSIWIIRVFDVICLIVF